MVVVGLIVQVTLVSKTCALLRNSWMEGRLDWIAACCSCVRDAGESKQCDKRDQSKADSQWKLFRVFRCMDQGTYRLAVQECVAVAGVLKGGAPGMLMQHAVATATLRV